jgi:hypothetical protein
VARRGDLERTVSFWRLLRASDRTSFQQVDWASVLSDWATASARGRLAFDVAGDNLGGSVHPVDEVDYLVITKNRDDLPRQQHRSTGQVADVELRTEDWEIIESAFVSFLDFGNIFGFMQSANTAASPQAVAKWIDASKVLSERVIAEPVVDPRKWQKVRQAGGVTMLELAGPTNILRDVEEGPLRHLLGLGQMGEFKVEIKIKAARAKERHQDRRQLYDMTEAVLDDIGLDRVDKAKAKIYDDNNLGIRAETINLLKQRFSRKQVVSLQGGPGSRSVSETSAFGAMLAVAEDLRDELRQAVGDDQGRT